MNTAVGSSSSSLTRRERKHRRAVGVGLATLVFLALGPLAFEHLLARPEMWNWAGDHFGSFCLIALHLLLQPVHYTFHGLLAAGVVYAVWDRWRAWRLLRSVLAPIDHLARVPTAEDAFGTAARTAGVDRSRIRVVSELPNPAFTVGAVRPRIYVAREVAEYLSPDELAAVLAHEAAHVARRDPLRFSLLRFVSSMLFWLPALARLADDAFEDAEVQADDTAARGRPLVLASAILRLAEWPLSPRFAAVTVNLHGRDLLDRRVKRLAGIEVPVESRLTRRSITWAAVAVVLLWGSSAVVAHPLPGAEHSHCDHHPAGVLSHLFCAGILARNMGDDCPHISSHHHT